MLVTASIGTRVTALHVVPSVELLYTMSFAEQLVRNLQSAHITYTFPDASICAAGSGNARMLPPTACSLIVATVTGAVHVVPPSVDSNARMLDRNWSPSGTITVPFGCTSGLPPVPNAPFVVPCFALHVLPPSVDVLIWILSPRLKSSHST